MNNRYWWFSSSKMTVYVATDDKDIIVSTAKIVQKFKGQHIKKLADWMRNQGGFQYEKLDLDQYKELARPHQPQLLPAEQRPNGYDEV